MSLDAYQNKIRVRVCGVLIQEEKVLLIKLRSPLSDELIWIPPGGGVNFGESREEALIREFEEETGFKIQPVELIYTNEVLSPPYHAIEFYYRVEKVGGHLEMGSDPEHAQADQIIEDLDFFSLPELKKLNVKPDNLYDLIIQ